KSSAKKQPLACSVIHDAQSEIARRSYRQLLDRKRSGSNQVRELQPLVWSKDRVDLTQRLQDRFSQSLRTLNPHRPTFAGLGVIERLARQRVGEGRQRPSPIHFRLGSLRLQLVEDAGERSHLRFVQAQSMGQESERPANAEAAKLVIVHFFA